MKPAFSSSLKTDWRRLVLLMGLTLCQTLTAAVTFSVSPSAVSNTYTGTLTLQIAGVSSSDTVLVQQYLDVNGNGTIDAGDWLVQQFPLTDGQPGMVIGGVTNLNVPGDLNSTAGSITASLNFVNGNFLPHVIGKFLFKLSSPAGRFAPITTPFNVASFPYPQKIIGTAVNNGTAVPYATVLLFVLRPGQTGPQGGPWVGAMANSAGSYTIPAPPGTYLAMAFKSNYVLNFAGASQVTLGAGATVTANPNLLSATTSISGKVVDAANAGFGVAGVMVSAESTTGLMGVTFSDPNGNFTVGVQSGQWGVRVDDTTLAVPGYVGSKDRTTVNSGATGVTLAIPKATALVYGSVKDTLGNPLAGVDVYVDDGSSSNLYQMDGYTDPNGNYVVGVIGGGDSWWAGVSTDSSPTNYIFTGGSSLTLAAGDAVPVNFTALLAAGQITGSLKDGNNNPITGVGIWASMTVNSVNYQANAATDNNGNYSLNVANGSWTVGINTCTDCNEGLPGSYLSPDSQTVNVTNNNPVVNFIAIPATAQVTGRLQDSNGNPIRGVGVYGQATINGLRYNANAGTDNNGNYSLSVANGDWTVGVMCSGGGNFNTLDNVLGGGHYQCPPSQSISIRNSNGTANFTVQLCSGVQILTTSLPAGQAGASYDTWLSASGCGGSLNWSVDSGSSLPAGLNLGSDGHLYGTPTTGGTFNILVHADDGNGHSADATLSLYIAPVAWPLQVTTTWLPTGTNGVFYSQTLQATGGQAPYAWSLAPYSASLPDNFTLSTNGILSGTPTTNGTFAFYVRVTDAAPATADLGLSLSILNPPLQITTTSLPDGNLAVGYTNQLTVTGGDPPYWWSLASGSAALPANLTLDVNGLISGVPAAGGTFNFLVLVSTVSGSQTKPLAITIRPAAALSAPVWLTNGFQMRVTGPPGQNYTLQMTTDLAPTNWTTLYVTNNPSTNTFNVTDPNALGLGRRFYRVQVRP